MRTAAFGCMSALIGVMIGALLVLTAALMVAPGLFQAKPPDDTVLLPDRPAVSVTASTQYLAQLMQPEIAKTGIARQATISLAPPNLIRIHSIEDFNLLGETVSVATTVTLGMTVQNGRIIVSVVGADAGGIEVPPELLRPLVEQLRAQGEQQVNAFVQQSLQGSRLRLSSIRIVAEGLTLNLDSS